MSALRIHIDIETFSEVDIKKAGVFKYAEHPSTEVLCMSYAVDDLPVQQWTPLQGEFPAYIFEQALENGICFAAHNAGFEMTVLNGPAGKAIGFPYTDPGAWIDTAAKAAAHSLPRDLGGCAKALGLTHKDEEGKRVMLKLSKPRKPTKTNPATRYHYADAPEDFNTLYAYCDNDVVVEREIDDTLPDLIPEEQRLWELDYTINRRGLYIDRQVVTDILSMVEVHQEHLVEKALRLCGFSTSQRDEIMAWCDRQGYPLKWYTAEYIRDILKDPAMPANVRQVLEIRREASKTSVKKFNAMRTSACEDGRIRGMFLFHGAGTGRWAGRIVQLQNLPRGKVKNVIEAILVVLGANKDTSYLEMLYGSLMDLFSALIRPTIMSAPGKDLMVSDFSSIEARVLGWIAEEPKYQEAFVKDLDLYKVSASDTFGVPYEKVNKDQRQFGKVCILALGYQMGFDTFRKTCDDWGVEADDELLHRGLDSYRSNFSKIKALWWQVNKVALQAVQTGRVMSVAKCRIGVKGDFLYIQLPSKRKLAYYKPRIQDVKTSWGEMRPSLTFMGENPITKKWERQSTYGGKLVENIVQAIARDLLRQALFNVEAAGYEVIGHVHDEILAEVPEGFGSVHEFEQLMSNIPDWAEGCIVGAEGWRGKRYKK